MLCHWITLKFNDYIDVIYAEEPEFKDTTEVPKWALYLDLRVDLIRMVDLTQESTTNMMTDFPMVNLQYLSRNIPESSAYGVFVSQFILYARVCSK